MTTPAPPMPADTPPTPAPTDESLDKLIPATPPARVATSTIPHAGSGLFATERLVKGAVVVEYTGEVLRAREATRRRDRTYMKMVSLDKHIDAVDPAKSSVARYANDHPDAARINCRFHTVQGRVLLRTLRAVNPGEELFVSYGRGHWLFCEDAGVAQAFLGLELVRGGVRATTNFEKGEMLCVKSSPLWTDMFGPGLGAAIAKETTDPAKANCEYLRNPLLRGTIMVRAKRDIAQGEMLVVDLASNAAALDARAAAAVVSGFGAFHGVKENPTTWLIGALRKRANAMGLLALDVFETSMQGVHEGLDKFDRIVGAFAKQPRITPDTVVWVHFGVYAGQPHYHLESTAHNLAEFSVPDERGNMPLDAPIVDADEFEAQRVTSVDTDALAAELRRLGHDRVRTSDDPGRFICNYAYYSSLARVQPPFAGKWGHDDSLFVHVPGFDAVPPDELLRFATDVLRLVCSRRFAPRRNVMNCVGAPSSP